MIKANQMENIMGWILLIGTSLSALLVIVGGTMLLTEHTHVLLKSELMSGTKYHVGFVEMYHYLQQHLSIGLIELGLLCLVMTQVIRIALLACYYAIIHDKAFTFISLFILCIMLYSTLWEPYHG